MGEKEQCQENVEYYLTVSLVSEVIIKSFHHIYDDVPITFQVQRVKLHVFFHPLCLAYR